MQVHAEKFDKPSGSIANASSLDHGRIKIVENVVLVSLAQLLLASQAVSQQGGTNRPAGHAVHAYGDVSVDACRPKRRLPSWHQPSTY